MIPGVDREVWWEVRWEVREIQWQEIQSGGSGLIENQAMGSIHFESGEMQPRSMVRWEDWFDSSGALPDYQPIGSPWSLGQIKDDGALNAVGVC